MKTFFFSLCLWFSSQGGSASDSNHLEDKSNDTLEARINLLENDNKKLKTEVKELKDDMKEFHSIECYDWKSDGSGIRPIQLKYVFKTVYIYCDQDTDHGGWNVFQRRQDGSVDFYLEWSDYRNGFGDPEKEFWLGLETLHQMTNDGRIYELRIDLEKQNGSKYYAVYDEFSIGSESEGYAIHFTDYSGNAGDMLIYNKDMKFSTEDSDQDEEDYRNCARLWMGPWWHKECGIANLNGLYKGKFRYTNYRGVFDYYVRWNKITSEKEALIRTEMKFRVKL